MRKKKPLFYMKPIPPQPEPLPPPKQTTTTSLWGRLFHFIFGSKVESEAEKTSLLAKEKIEKKSEKPSLTLQEKYEHNFKKILETKNFTNLSVENGMLQTKKKTESYKKHEVEQLVQQTYRQAWGRLIDADYGFRVKEEELQRLNQLKTHLHTFYKDGIPKAPLGQPLENSFLFL